MIQNTIKALNDPVRRQILEMLKKGPLAVNEILENLDVSGATLSHHLKILKNANLVEDTKEKNFIYYEINTSVMEDVIGWMTGFIKGAK